MPGRTGIVRSTLRWVSAFALVAWSLLWGTLLVLLASAGEIVAPWGVALPAILLGLAAGSILVPRVAGVGALLLAVAGFLLFDLPPLRFATPFAGSRPRSRSAACCSPSAVPGRGPREGAATNAGARITPEISSSSLPPS